MNYFKAQELLTQLSETYLFSGIVAFAGEDDYDINEEVLKLFENIEGVGIGIQAEEDYFLIIYHNRELKNESLISDFLNINPEELHYKQTEPFELLSGRNRPLTIGSSISHIESDIYGTLGCFVKNDQNEVYLLTNRHVLFNAKSTYQDDYVLQPAKIHGGVPNDSIAKIKDMTPFDEKDINDFDAAIAGPLAPDIDLFIPSFKDGRKIRGAKACVPGMEVYKTGVSTGLTWGLVGSVNASFKVTLAGAVVAFRNQVVINGTREDYQTPDAFCLPGDSGAVIIENSSSKAVGLLFAGSLNRDLGLCNPINEVLNTLGIAILNN